jgi:hypothetical protein
MLSRREFHEEGKEEKARRGPRRLIKNLQSCRNGGYCNPSLTAERKKKGIVSFWGWGSE